MMFAPRRTNGLPFSPDTQSNSWFEPIILWAVILASLHTSLDGRMKLGSFWNIPGPTHVWRKVYRLPLAVDELEPLDEGQPLYCWHHQQYGRQCTGLSNIPRICHMKVDVQEAPPPNFKMSCMGAFTAMAALRLMLVRKMSLCSFHMICSFGCFAGRASSSVIIHSRARSLS